MTRTILVVDDEPGIVDFVSYALQRDGYAVETAATGEDALRHVRGQTLDVVVLDVMLPDGSGIDVCRRIRAESDVPVIMLTARDAETDVVVGLEAGADDYVTKPFSMAELAGRIRALLRRRELDASARGAQPVREAAGIRVDLGRHEATVDGRRVALTPSEFRILALLVGQPDRAFTRREIMQHIWNTPHVPDVRTCDAHVSNLRRKLGTPSRIATVRGVGYRLAADAGTAAPG
ncbi:MAG TPA: response regulator transcription factor [Gaiellaceae bacterium]|nr:response regulator transcription factor [Gaiellaceae bacterium]